MLGSRVGDAVAAKVNARMRNASRTVRREVQLARGLIRAPIAFVAGTAGNIIGHARSSVNMMRRR